METARLVSGLSSTSRRLRWSFSLWVFGAGTGSWCWSPGGRIVVELDCEDSALVAALAGDRKCAAVEFDEHLGDCETEAQAAVAAR